VVFNELKRNKHEVWDFGNEVK